MANINIKYNGKDILLSSDDGQKNHNEELSMQINTEFQELQNDLGNIGENKLVLITSINIMAEYFDTKTHINNRKKKLLKLTDKLNELKSLV